MQRKTKLIVKASYKAGREHQSHTTGTGPHDKRPKRKRTRQSSNSFAIKDSHEG